MRSFGKSNGGGRRKATREEAPVLAVLSTVTHDHRAALMNLSSTGARLASPVLPDEGAEVIFRADKVQSFGRIVWKDSSQCGVAFEAPLPRSDVEWLRDQSELWGLPGSTAEDRAMVADWHLGVAR